LKAGDQDGDSKHMTALRLSYPNNMFDVCQVFAVANFIACFYRNVTYSKRMRILILN